MPSSASSVSLAEPAAALASAPPCPALSDGKASSTRDGGASASDSESESGATHADRASGRVRQAVERVEHDQRLRRASASTAAGGARPQAQARDRRLLFASARDVVRASLSPRSKATKAASAGSPQSPGASVAPVRTAFGRFRRSSTLAGATASADVPPGNGAPAGEPPASRPTAKSQQQPNAPSESRPPTSPLPTQPIGADGSQPPDEAAAAVGRGFVDEVRRTLEELVQLLDSVDPRKLVAIRLGGELRGLLGKAQDEFCAYEAAFVEHAGHVGVSIALQNLSAALRQVFALAARLQTAKFLLNKTFKRDVTFAFQEINSYYTSLFMELSMAVARRSGIDLPLPSPMKPQPPSPVAEAAAEATEGAAASAAATQTDEEPPPESRVSAGDQLCLEAHMLFFGHGVAQDRLKARELYQAAAEQGNAQAMACLGHMYLTGDSAASAGAAAHSRDLLLAEQWLQRAVAAGSVDAAAFLGQLMCEKAELAAHEHDWRALYALAKDQFSLAASRGHSEAQFQLGALFERGLASETPELEAAAHWYARAAEQQHTDAEARLGRLHLLGGAAPALQDTSRGVHFLERAAAKGDADSQALLGAVYCAGAGVKRDADRGVAFLRSAADKGNAEAMTRLALVLLASVSLGRGGTGEPAELPAGSPPAALRFGDREALHDEAVRLLLTAALAPAPRALGRPAHAQFALGELLEASPLLADRAAALRFYCKAARSEPCHVLAARRAAAMHYSGLGCAADKAQARHLYTLAADAGDADALNALGLMCEEGEGGELDLKRAALCYRAAVARGHAHAHFNLGHLLARGRGVPRDPEAARAHFERAAALGYSLAHQFLPPT